MPVHVAGFEGGDRTSIELPSVQQSLLEAIAASGKPLIVVLMNGSAIASRGARSMRTPWSRHGIRAKRAAVPSPQP